MNKKYIEQVAFKLQKEIWLRREEIWPTEIPSPENMLAPDTGAIILGINFEEHEQLGRFGSRGDRFELAGILERQKSRIAVSLKFKPETVRFTGAHELGHWLLHPGEVMHRDRPIHGLSTHPGNRNKQEKEADYFAACFLMPRKLIRKTFKINFLTVLFIFDDTNAFWLCPNDPDSMLRSDNGSLDRALALAGAESYAGRHFKSLAKHFNVSTTTMAIRLKELNLYQEN